MSGTSVGQGEQRTHGKAETEATPKSINTTVSSPKAGLSFESEQSGETSLSRKLDQRRASTDDRVIASMVSNHLMDVYQSTADAAHSSEEIFDGLSLTSAVSERELNQEKQQEVSKEPQDEEQSHNEKSISSRNRKLNQEGSEPPTPPKAASIELSDGSYRLDSSMKPTKNQPVKSYQYRLKNGDRSAEAVFISFGLYALERNFEIVSTAPNETCVRQVHHPSRVAKLLAMCCLSSKTTQLYQLVQNRGRSETVTVNLVEGTQEEFECFTKGLRQKLWDINEIKQAVYYRSISDAENLELFLELHRRTTIKELREELFEPQNKRRASYLLELWVERVVETSDVLIDTYAVRNAAASARDNTTIAKFVFSESGIITFFGRIFANNEKQLGQKRKKIVKELTDKKIFEDLQTNRKLMLLESSKLAEGGEDRPYCRAVLQLDKLNNCELPAQKLQCLSQYSKLVEDCYRSYHQEDMPVELSDQLLPVHAFCVLKITAADLYPTLKLLEQFVRRNSKLGSSLPIVSSLVLAAEQICAWKI